MFIQLESLAISSPNYRSFPQVFHTDYYINYRTDVYRDTRGEHQSNIAAAFAFSNASSRLLTVWLGIRILNLSILSVRSIFSSVRSYSNAHYEESQYGTRLIACAKSQRTVPRFAPVDMALRHPRLRTQTVNPDVVRLHDITLQHARTIASVSILENRR